MIKEQKHSSGAPARKVLLAGYYGFGNAGDEAILSVIVEDLGRLAGPIDIVVVSGDPEATTKSYNLRAVRFTDIARIIDEIETCDLVILGGGGLFQDYWGFDPTNLLTRNYTNIAYYGTMAVLATILDKHLMLYSVGVGPLFSQPSREHTRLSFEQASRATVRDAESRALLAACGLDPSRVEVCADPAFRLEPASKQEARNILKAEGLSMNGEPLIGVSLRSWSMGASIEHWTREVAKALDWFVSRHNARLLFLPLQTTGEHLTDDSAISKQVIDQLRKKELAHIIRGEYRAREIAGLLAVCDMVVGMRLHSIIFAANSSVPAVGLVYDEKVRIVMKQLKCDRLAIDLGAVTAGDLLRAMEQAYADREAISTSLRTYHEELALRSERSSILAAELLKELPQKLRPLPIDIQDLLKQAALNLADQIEVREKTIDRLKAELKDLALSSAEKDQNISSLLGQLDERRQAAGAFAGLLSEKEQTIGSLSESLTRLRRRAAEDEKLIDELNSLISDLQSQILEQLEKFVEKQSQVDSLGSKLADAEKLAAERDQTILSLQARVLEKEQEIDTLALQLAEKGRVIQKISRDLSEKDSQLERITNSLGWRLLSLYGPIKYRYLLPLYRFLRLMPPQRKPGRPTETTSLVSHAQPERVEAADTGASARASEPSASTSSETEEESGTASLKNLVPWPFIDLESNAYDVVCLPIIEWDFRFQRPQQLMTQFARAGHRVFYIRQTFRASGEPYTIEEKTRNIYEVSLRGPDRNVYRDQLDEQSCDWLFSSLDALRRDLSISAAVIMIELPFWWPLAKRAATAYAWPAIYDCMDHHAGFSTNSPRMIEQEIDLLNSADLVVASSAFLEEEARKYNNDVLLVRNGCDFDHFAKMEAVGSARPVVGYYGAIADWFDADLVADLAEKRTDWDFVLVGSTFTADTSRLSILPNVSLPGEKPYSEIPEWLARFDVAIIPFKRTPLTEATNPVKAYEILSSGRPLVSVPLPEVVPLAPLVRLASTVEEFEREIEAALEETEPGLIEGRRQFAGRNRWEDRFDLLAPAVRDTFPQVSIIIVTFNNLDMNRLCLESLYGRTEWPNFEVIVIDNASSDATPEYLREAEKIFPNLRVVLNSNNRGFAAANNQGLGMASGEYLVLLNNDTVITRGGVWSLIKHLHSDTSIGLIGPTTNEIGNEAKVQVGYERLEDMLPWAADFVRQNDGLTFSIPVLAMFCVAMRREVYERIGMLDEDFQIGMFEDDDYSRRVREQGWKVVCARDSFIHHFGRAAFSLLSDRQYLDIFEKNRKVYEEKWGMWEPHLDERDRGRISGLRERLSEIVWQSHIEPERVVVFLPSIGWNTPLVQRPHHLAAELARQGYLVFFDCSGSVIDNFADFISIEKNLWIYKGPKGVLDSLERPILWTLPYNAHMIDRWAEATVVYDFIDDLSVFPYKQALLTKNHNRLLERADLVLYVARKLEGQLNDRRSYALYLPNGVEHLRFYASSTQDELDFRFTRFIEEGRPVIGYYGAIASWLDAELLAEVAEMRKDWGFVIIGQQLPDAPSLNKLRRNENVLLLSAQRYETLPGYLSRFTAAMIPFKINRITEATSPLKLFEYFAGGKPVISTPMPECEAFDEVIIARNPGEFSLALDEAMKRSTDRSFRSRLRDIARRNSWEVRVRTIDRTLRKLAGGKSARGSKDSTGPESASQSEQATSGAEIAVDAAAEIASLFRRFRNPRNRNLFDALAEHMAPMSTDASLRSLFEYAITCNDRGRQTADFISKHLDPVGKRYLDIGCAYGGGLVAFSERGAEVVGFESDDSLLRLASCNLIDNGLNVPLYSIDPVEQKDSSQYLESFDIINCNDTINRVADAGAYIQKIAGMLRPGGIAYFETPNAQDSMAFVENGNGKIPGLTVIVQSDASGISRVLARKCRAL